MAGGLRNTAVTTHPSTVPQSLLHSSTRCQGLSGPSSLVPERTCLSITGWALVLRKWMI